MNIQRFDIEGPLLITPKIYSDNRGYFFESFNNQLFEEKTGQSVHFVQDNESLSSFGALRGLHFQKPPFAQAKLVRVLKGKVLDVAVDIRHQSPTYGKHISVELNEENKHHLFIPKGFAHGFAVLSETAIFMYKVDAYYSPDHDSGILWNDPALNIDWGLNSEDIILSKKDTSLQTFETYSLKPDFV